MSIRVFAKKDKPKAAEILIYDYIGEDWLGDGVTAKGVDEKLTALGEVKEIVVRINSPGGSVFDGIAIYNQLKANTATISVVIEGVAASAASIIAMAGDTITMGTATQMMIHNPWTMAAGEADDFRKTADTLDKIRDGMLDAYAERTGLDRKTLQAMCNAETWMGPDEAIENGFATAKADLKSTASARASAWGAVLAKFKQVPAGVSAMTTSADFQAAEANRREEIRNLFTFPSRGGFEPEFRNLLDTCLDDMRITPEMASKRLLAKMAEGAEPLRTSFSQFSTTHGATHRASGDFRNAAVDALLMRAGIPVSSPAPGAADMRSMSVLDMARTCLNQADHRSSFGSKANDPSRIIKAALSTSDFPWILENTLGKSLRQGYTSEPQSHTAWVRQSTVDNFRAQSRVLLGSAPALLKVPELGEYKEGSLTEDKTSLMIEKFGRVISLSWEMLVNDDLGAFTQVPSSLGQAARRAEADEVYSLFSANSGAGILMQDGVNLFHANHGNVSATVGAISIATLGAARTLLRKQQALGGGYMNLTPRFLIVPAESETLAEQVLAQATRHVDASSSSATAGSNTTGTNTGREISTPEWVSRLQLIVEPRLNPAHGFYLAAGFGQVDTVELITLGGEPTLEEQIEFVRDAKSYKIRHAFDAKPIDWRGLVRVPAS